jgi:hypothetical protein
MKLLILSILLAACAMAQSTHSVTLNWVDTANPAGTTYSIYRATGLCSGTPVWSKLATGITVKTYKDDPVAPGNYCYVATSTYNGMESAQSPTAAAAVPSFPPTAISVVVQ